MSSEPHQPGQYFKAGAAVNVGFAPHRRAISPVKLSMLALGLCRHLIVRALV